MALIGAPIDVPIPTHRHRMRVRVEDRYLANFSFISSIKCCRASCCSLNFDTSSAVDGLAGNCNWILACGRVCGLARLCRLRCRLLLDARDILDSAATNNSIPDLSVGGVINPLTLELRRGQRSQSYSPVVINQALSFG